MNRLIVVFITSDVLILSALAVFSPIFAVFITEQIQGGTLSVVGLAATVFMLSKALTQVFVGKHIDKISGELDDFKMIFLGSVLISLVPFAYALSHEIWHIYAIQMIYGIGAGMSFPAWMSVFSRHLDHRQEGIEWGGYSTSVLIAAAATAALGGIIAERFGFFVVFFGAGMLSLIGAFVLFFARKQLFISDHQPIAGKKVEPGAK